MLAQVSPQQVETIFTHPYWVQSKSQHNPTLPLHILPSPPQLLHQPTLLAFMHFRPIGGHLSPQLPCSYPKEGPPKKKVFPKGVAL